MPCLTGLSPSQLIQMIVVVADGLTADAVAAAHCRSAGLLRKNIEIYSIFWPVQSRRKVSFYVCVSEVERTQKRRNEDI